MAYKQNPGRGPMQKTGAGLPGQLHNAGPKQTKPSYDPGIQEGLDKLAASNKRKAAASASRIKAKEDSAQNAKAMKTLRSKVWREGQDTRTGASKVKKALAKTKHAEKQKEVKGRYREDQASILSDSLKRAAKSEYDASNVYNDKARGGGLPTGKNGSPLEPIGKTINLAGRKVVQTAINEGRTKKRKKGKAEATK